MSEEAIENEIQEKGLTAPRLIPAQIDNAIAGEDYHVFPATSPVCCLTLKTALRLLVLDGASP